MYIERVEIFGFKSFARKTELVFGPGLCVIMGPNGCGKTNILDAIRWAIGEQRLSLLRTSLLEDVIFNGSAGARALNFAEVSVQLADAAGLLPYDPRAEKIRITRRAFRDGESQFLINGAPVRLKDIRRILASVGLGDVGYAVIEQQMIDRILGGGADERRALFEQAAGIAKYKADKAATESKLRATQQDLVRLEDILREVSEQEAILRRQASRARRYRRLLEQARKLEMEIAAGRLARYEENLSKVKAQAEEFRLELQRLSAELADVRARLQRASAKRNDLERKRNEIVSFLGEVERRISEREQRIAVLAERLRNAEAAVAAAEKAASKLEARIKGYKEEEERLQKNLAAFEKKLEDVDLRVAELAQKVADVDAQALELRKKLDDLSQKDQKLRERMSELMNGVSFGEAELEKLRKRRKELFDRAEEKRRTLLRKVEQVKALRSQCAQLEASVAEVEQKLDALRSARAEVTKQLTKLSDELSALRQKRLVLAGRLEEINGIISRGEDIGRGAHAILMQGAAGVLGVVADLVDVEPELSAAAELALGERVNFLVAEDVSAALAAAKKIPPDGGEVGFIILSELEGADPPDWVRLREPRIAALLADARLVDEVGDDPGGTVVSTDGRLLRRRGELRARGEKSQKGALALRATAAKIKSEIEKLDGQISSLEDDEAKISSQLAELEDEISSHEELRRSQAQRLSAISGELRFQEMQEKELRLALEQLEDALRDIDGDIQGRTKQLERWRSELDELRSARMDLSSELDELSAALSEAQKRRSELERELSAAQIERITVDGEIRHLRQDIERARIALESAQQELAKTKESTAEAKKTIASCSEETKRLEGEVEKLFARREELLQAQDELRSELESVEGRLSSLARRERELSAQRDGLAQKLSDAEKEASALEATIDELCRSAHENFGEVPAAQKPLSEEDEASLQAKLVGIRRRIEQWGAVNLEAEEQHELVKKRLDFLREQKADIVESIGDLRSTISRLDAEARRLFTKTFDAARKRFGEVFAQLFEDGEADLELQNPNDPLSSDIIVKVKPAGKRQLSLSQLSAGEKALTALALLFGLYLVKPAPFCLMDEVDAPLDDVNVSRFLRLVRRFSDRVQFIVISHNTKTLQSADYLYGVSMEKDGISKVVSVKMSDLRLI